MDRSANAERFEACASWKAVAGLAERYRRIAARRVSGPVVILDIAVPRDFDPGVHVE